MRRSVGSEKQGGFRAIKTFGSGTKLAMDLRKTRESVCNCATSATNEEHLVDDVALELEFCIKSCWTIADTAACPVLVDRTWIYMIGGRIGDKN